MGKIRNGFVPNVKADVAKRFRGLETTDCPFANLPEPKTARRGLALTLIALTSSHDFLGGSQQLPGRFVPVELRSAFHRCPGTLLPQSVLAQRSYCRSEFRR